MWTVGQRKRTRWIVSSGSRVGREEDIVVVCDWLGEVMSPVDRVEKGGWR